MGYHVPMLADGGGTQATAAARGTSAVAPAMAAGLSGTINAMRPTRPTVGGAVPMSPTPGLTNAGAIGRQNNAMAYRAALAARANAANAATPGIATNWNRSAPGITPAPRSGGGGGGAPQPPSRPGSITNNHGRPGTGSNPNDPNAGQPYRQPTHDPMLDYYSAQLDQINADAAAQAALAQQGYAAQMAAASGGGGSATPPDWQTARDKLNAALMTATAANANDKTFYAGMSNAAVQQFLAARDSARNVASGQKRQLRSDNTVRGSITSRGYGQGLTEAQNAYLSAYRAAQASRDETQNRARHGLTDSGLQLTNAQNAYNFGMKDIDYSQAHWSPGGGGGSGGNNALALYNLNAANLGITQNANNQSAEIIKNVMQSTGMSYAAASALVKGTPTTTPITQGPH